MLQLISPSGFNVFVGRNVNENHCIVTRLIKGSDLWFHSKNTTGAHVLMCLSKKDIWLEEDVNFCKELALKYSSNKKDNNVTVAFGCDVFHHKGDPKGCARLV